MQLASFLEDPQYQDQHSLHMEIIKTFGRVGPNAEPRFRDECKALLAPHIQYKEREFTCLVKDLQLKTKSPFAISTVMVL